MKELRTRTDFAVQAVHAVNGGLKTCQCGGAYECQEHDPQDETRRTAAFDPMFAGPSSFVSFGQ